MSEPLKTRMSKSSTTYKKSETRQRTELVSIRMTPKEKERFLGFRDKMGLSTGEYGRARLLRKPFRSDAPKTHRMSEKFLSKILAQLGKWGSNLNQIAHAMNIAKKEPTYSESYAAKRLAQYETQIAQMQSVLNECHALIINNLLKNDTKG